MKGILVPTTKDEDSDQHYGVQLGETIFPVPDREVGVRNIRPDSEVTFITDRTGRAILDQPPPARGCERLKG